MDDLKHLGRPSNQPVDRVDLIPWTAGPVYVRLDCSEFTSLCPVTGQPDFAKLIIEYAPGEHLMETKSLKLYLWNYRERKAFNEALIGAIADDLNGQLAPKWLRVSGRFNPRGGISVYASAERGDREHRPK